MNEKSEKNEEQIRETGKDEMNLVEFPITLLSKRHVGSSDILEFSDEIRGEGGKIIKREWIVTGSKKFGLPLAIDNDVWLALLHCGLNENFSSRKIHFTKYRLCAIMSRETGGSGYKRIEEALDRLKGVSVKAKNAFWDNDKKGYVTKSFGLIDDYELFEGSKPGRPAQDTFAFSYVNLNEVIYESIKAGYIKTIDTKIYFKLNSAITKRLYRYLDKKRYDGKKRFEINLFTLAYTHIGFDPETYKKPSLIKQKLATAHKELIEAGFLRSAEYRKTSDRTSEKVIYVFGGSLELPGGGQTGPGRQREECQGSELMERLVQMGVNRKVAEQILREYPEEAVRVQLEALPYRRAEEPLAVLISSIQNNWALPLKYEGHLGRKAEKQSDRKRREDEQREKADLKKKIEEYISRLSRDELAELTGQARERAREDGGVFFNEREISQPMIQAYIHVLVEKQIEEQERTKSRNNSAEDEGPATTV